jgi:hypothetical protein
LSDPTGECTTCQAVQKDSRKVVHRLPCLRWKISAITVSRTDDPRGALELTKRWQGFDLTDIDGWATVQVRTIQLSLGVCSTPITIKVRKFKPRPGDVICRRWRDGNMIKQTNLEPYALVNIRQSASDVIGYLNENAVRSLEHMSRDGGTSDIVRETFGWAVRHYRALWVSSHGKLQRSWLAWATLTSL